VVIVSRPPVVRDKDRDRKDGSRHARKSPRQERYRWRWWSLAGDEACGAAPSPAGTIYECLFSISARMAGCGWPCCWAGGVARCRRGIQPRGTAIVGLDASSQTLTPGTDGVTGACRLEQAAAVPPAALRQNATWRYRARGEEGSTRIPSRTSGDDSTRPARTKLVGRIGLPFPRSSRHVP